MTPERTPKAVQDGRVCLLVLGMHRSGTSALAGMLVQMGAAPPATPMAPHFSNPRGFFESVPLRDFNDALLSALGSKWNDLRPLPPDWLNRAEVLAMQAQAQALIAAEFGEARLFALKDPRICRLLPFWKLVFAAAGIGVVAVLTHRHPDEVAASLENRYASDPSASRLLWLRHVLEAEAASRDLQRCFTSYDRLLADPVAEARRIVQNLALPPMDETAAAGFISDELRTQRAERVLRQGAQAGAQVQPEGGLSPWYRETLAVVERLAEGEADLDALDRIGAELDRAAAAIAPVLDNYRVSEAELRKATRELAACRERNSALQAELARLREAP